MDIIETMWTPDIPWLAGAATAPSRSGRRVLVVLVVLSALGAGLFGLGHDHSDGGLSDDDHCALCHAQQSTLLPEPIAETTSLATPRGSVPLIDLAPDRSPSSRHLPPHRGPPDL